MHCRKPEECRSGYCLPDFDSVELCSTCQTPGKVGEPCNDASCELGLVCWTDHRCRKESLLGEACDAETWCERFTRCVDGVCVPFPRAGEPCWNGVCDPNFELTCDPELGICVEEDGSSLGETCGPNCAPGGIC
ncbi:MAG TPA: hypothetical protein VF103_00640, partial [Polyangiaceae bacterium]